MALGALGNGALTRTGAPAESRPTPGIAEVYEQHFRYVWRCLRSLGVRESSLDDALQDVFVVVQRRLPEFDGRAELRTWLYAIALRVGRKYRARAAREPRSLDDESERPEQVAPGDTERAAESRQRLLLARLALGALDDDKREVFVLARIEQMSAPEIADIVGIPLNTVYSRLRLARDAFDAAIARLESRKDHLP
jgi:RNA polymerase sigma-70 factor, ECF subfamily